MESSNKEKFEIEDFIYHRECSSDDFLTDDTLELLSLVDDLNIHTFSDIGYYHSPEYRKIQVEWDYKSGKIIASIIHTLTGPSQETNDIYETVKSYRLEVFKNHIQVVDIEFPSDNFTSLLGQFVIYDGILK